MEVAIQLEAAGKVGQEQRRCIRVPRRPFVGRSRWRGWHCWRAEAAQEVIDWLRGLEPARNHDWVQILRTLDAHLSSARSLGETTAVVAFVTDQETVGASVGDSGGWMLAFGAWLNLLEDQRRKPLLGTGSAVPVGFGPVPTGERVLLGSDGLFKYVDADRIGRLASISPLERAARELVQAARLPSGNLQDDVAVVIAG